MRPIIGITTHLSEDERTIQLNRTYTDVLMKSGALPILLPATTDAQLIDQYAQQIDGLLLSGGGDVNPLLFGETTEWACGAISVLRDEFEMKLCAAMLRSSRKPILGICRGFQVMNIALGGTLYQDIQSGYKGKSLSHRQKQRGIYCSHSVSVYANTRLHELTNSDQIMVNSLHHQAVKELPAGFIASAVAPDGVIEAAELVSHPFCMGVQWHPEILCEQAGSEAHAHLFQHFVAACRQNTPPKIVIRAETPDDHHASELVTQRAFWNLHGPGCNEHYLVRLLRSDPACVKELTRVAEVDGEVVGLIMYSRAELENPDGTLHNVLTFGPLAVDPRWQNCGVGSALLHETIQAAKELGYRGIIIFGEPGYYPRHGFSPCSKWRITTADGKNFDAFMGLELQPGGLDHPGAKFHEAAVFTMLPPDDVDEYNTLFPTMTKLHLPGQWTD